MQSFKTIHDAYKYISTLPSDKEIDVVDTSLSYQVRDIKLRQQWAARNFDIIIYSGKAGEFVPTIKLAETPEEIERANLRLKNLLDNLDRNETVFKDNNDISNSTVEKHNRKISLFSKTVKSLIQTIGVTTLCLFIILIIYWSQGQLHFNWIPFLKIWISMIIVLLIFYVSSYRIRIYRQRKANKKLLSIIEKTIQENKAGTA